MRSPAPGRDSRYVSAFYLLSSLAEAAQAVTLLWLAFQLTHDGLVVGIAVALGYLPAAAAGLVFQRFADAGRPDRLTHRTNVVLAVVSLLLALETLAAPRATWITIAAIMASQVVLSLVKMVNKAAIGRVLRDSFAPETCRQVLQVSSSTSLIGRLAGAATAGVIIDQGPVEAALALAGVAYAASVTAMRRGTRGYRPRPGVDEARDERPGARGARRLVADRRLALVLLFSVPSSGALPFLSTLIVPLAHDVAPAHPGYYAALVVVSTVGGFAAGAALSTSVLSSRVTLDVALPVTAGLAVALALAGGEVPVAALTLALTFAITAHIVCMQVLTNQLPDPEEVGQFAVLRNVVASLAKGGYSFAAGALVDVVGTGTAALVLGGSCVPFAVAWLAFRARAHAGALGVS